MSCTQIEEQLALTELLIALAEANVATQRALLEQCGLQGSELGEALTKLAFYETSEALRKAERKRIRADLANALRTQSR